MSLNCMEISYARSDKTETRLNIYANESCQVLHNTNWVLLAVDIEDICQVLHNTNWAYLL